MWEIFLLVLGILLFSGLVILHEYGHFLVAKRNGVKVNEFGLGFPPKLIGRTLGKGIFRGYYSLNLFPIGGFVRLEGENDAATSKGSYGSKSLWVKTKIISAGVIVNFLIAILLFTILAWVGIPKLLPAEPNFSDEQFSLASDTEVLEQRTFIGFVFEDSPAALADLAPGDEVVSLTDVAGEETHLVRDSNHLYNLTEELAGKEVSLVYLREDARHVASLNLRTLEQAEETGTGRLGVSSNDFILQRNTWSAPITGVMLSLQYTKVTFQGLWQTIGALFAGDTETAKNSVTGPIGVFYILRSSAEYGFQLTLMVIALLSLTLAIINALPIPALDGGRLVLTLFFRKVIRRPLTKEIENRIVFASMVGLIALMVLVAVIDVQRFIL